jgi:hypothetical protein
MLLTTVGLLRINISTNVRDDEMKISKSSCDKSEKLDLDSDNRLRLYVMYARPVN